MSRIWSALQKSEQTLRRSSYDAPAFAVSGTAEQMPADDSSRAFDLGSTAGKVQAEHFSRIICHTDPASPGADTFRLLRMRLHSLWTAGEVKSFVVTSPLPQDGKTTVALNLATALSEQRTKRVLLVDADLHRPSVDQRLGLSPALGLTECLQDGVEPRSVIRSVEPLGWYLLSHGKDPSANPTEILRPREISGLLHKLSPDFDWIIIDSPPALILSDSLSLAEAVDGSLLVARAGRTPRKAIEDTIDLLGKKHVLGLVLNGMDRAENPYSRYQNCYRTPDAPDAD